MNAVFIHIPKTAGIFVQDSLPMKHSRFLSRAKRFDNQGLVTFGHMSYLSMVRRGYVSEEFDRTAFKFAFCRCPYDRAVSHYHYARKKHPDILDPSISFLDWTRNLGNHKGKFRPQSTWLHKIKMDFIGRFENLKHDLKWVANRLNVEIRKIKPQNVTKHNHYALYYCEESKHNIEQYYQADFEKFGYEHDDYLLHKQSA